MSANRPGGKRRRLLVPGIVLGILVPSGLLGFLGFRSFRYEHALLKKQALERHASLSDLMHGQAEGAFRDLLASLKETAASKDFSNWDVPAFSARLLEFTALKNLPVRSVHVYAGDDNMVFPAAGKPAFSPRATEQPLDWGLHAADIQRLERLELEEKKPREAAQGYEALRLKPMPPALQAALLRTLAAVHRKAGDLPKAEAAYLDLINAHEDVSDPRGLPMGVTGRRLLGRFYEETGRPERAAAVRLDLAEKLLLNRWALPTDSKETLLDEAVGRLADDARRGRLEDIRRRLRALVPDATRSHEKAWPAALRALRERGSLDRGDVLRPDAGQDLLVVAPLHGPGGQRRGLIAARLDAAPLWAGLERSLAGLAGPSGLGVRLIPSVRPSDPPFHRPIDALHPPHALELTAPASTESEALFHRRVKIYGATIGLSLLVAVSGLVLLVTAVRREVQAANMKAEFVANVSHELRTPLYTISHIGERLDLGRYRSPEEAKEFYAMLREETQRLRELVENVLDFSRMMDGRNPYKTDPLDLAAVAREAHRLFQPKASAFGFEVVLQAPETPLPTVGDKDALLQAAINLLDNALKYSGDARRIVLSAARDEGETVLSVQDEGVGIAPRLHKKIFEKFYRVESADTRHSEGGVGLGLAIVKHIVESHQGRITLDSAPGRGSRFSLYFALREA